MEENEFNQFIQKIKLINDNGVPISQNIQIPVQYKSMDLNDFKCIIVDEFKIFQEKTMILQSKKQEISELALDIQKKLLQLDKYEMKVYNRVLSPIDHILQTNGNKITQPNQMELEQTKEIDFKVYSNF